MAKYRENLKWVSQWRSQEDLHYETVGMQPDVYLSKDIDWIEQVLKFGNRQIKSHLF